jgi:group I intron endonuclease
MKEKSFGYIYIIYNLINDKVYIGQTINLIEKRFRGHVKASRGIGNTSLSFAIRKHGIKNFDIMILHECDNQLQLNALERYYIRKFKSNKRKFGYNMTDGGESGYKANPDFIEKNRQKQIGKKHSEETKIKIRENSGRINPIREDEIESLIERNQNRDWNLESRMKVSDSSLYRTVSKEQSEAHRKAMTGRVWIHHNDNDKFVSPDKASKFVRCGWKFGRASWKDRAKKKSLRLWQKLKEPQIYFSNETSRLLQFQG